MCLRGDVSNSVTERVGTEAFCYVRSITAVDECSHD